MSGAVIDQALLSGASFLAALILVRYTPDRDYVVYVLLQTALVLVTSIHTSLICRPISVLAPRRAAEPRRRMIGAIRQSQNRWLWPLVLLALAVTALSHVTNMLSTSLTVIVGIGILAGWATVQRNYARNVLLIYSRVRALVAVDTLYAIALLAGVLWAAFGVAMAAAWVAAAMAVAAWVCALSANRLLARDPGWVSADAGPVWREIRSLGFWALAGSVVYWLFSRSYNYILAIRLDVVAVANVNAIRLMVMPAVLVTVGLQSMLTPLAAAWNVEVGFDGMVRRLARIALFVGTLDLLFFALVWISRGWISSVVLHKHIEDRDALLLLWVILSLLALIRDLLAPAVYALKHFKWLAWQIAACAAVALGVMWFGIPYWGAKVVLIAQIIGEIANVVGILYLIRRGHKRFHLYGDAAATGLQNV